MWGIFQQSNGGGGGGGISSIAVASENGFDGNVTGGNSAIIHLGTTVGSGSIIKSNGTAILAATEGTDYLATVRTDGTLTGNGTAGNLLSVVSSEPALTATFIGYGDGSNLLTGTVDLTFDVSTGGFVVGNPGTSHNGFILQPSSNSTITDIFSNGFIQLNGLQFGIGFNSTPITIIDAVNGFLNDITGTTQFVFNTTGIKLPTVQNFPNNAAAITGGLVAGNVYYTNVAGDGILKVVI